MRTESIDQAKAQLEALQQRYTSLKGQIKVAKAKLAAQKKKLEQLEGECEQYLQPPGFSDN
jgi:predicted  nucleic acid-binding Zn-ribbon protein